MLLNALFIILNFGIDLLASAFDTNSDKTFSNRFIIYKLKTLITLKLFLRLNNFGQYVSSLFLLRRISNVLSVSNVIFSFLGLIMPFISSASVIYFANGS